jgi:hypothetical protein
MPEKQMQILQFVQDDTPLLEWIQAKHGIGFGLWAMGKFRERQITRILCKAPSRVKTPCIAGPCQYG